MGNTVRAQKEFSELAKTAKASGIMLEEGSLPEEHQALLKEAFAKTSYSTMTHPANPDSHMPLGIGGKHED